jgi:hypothetical protein
MKSIGSIPLLLTLMFCPAATAQTFRAERRDAQSLEKEIEAQAAQLKGMAPAQKGELAESHIRAHVRLARALADGKQYALGVTTLRRAKAAAYQHMLPKRSREVIGALDDQITVIEWREKSDGRGLRCELFEEPDFTGLKKTRIDYSLDFAWSTAAPDIDVPGDSFSVRLTGFLRATDSPGNPGHSPRGAACAPRSSPGATSRDLCSPARSPTSTTTSRTPPPTRACRPLSPSASPATSRPRSPGAIS